MYTHLFPQDQAEVRMTALMTLGRPSAVLSVSLYEYPKQGERPHTDARIHNRRNPRRGCGTLCAAAQGRGQARVVVRHLHISLVSLHLYRMSTPGTGSPPDTRTKTPIASTPNT